MIKCNYNNISERDMDVLFLQLFSSDIGFVEFFLREAEIPSNRVSVVGIELSKTDPDLGESDITVILNVDGKRIELLVEDKIDAIAMPEQPERYIKRGQKAVEHGECEASECYIVCPQKYLDNNEAARKYPHKISYETIRDYLDQNSSPLYRAYCQQISQAIEKAKKPAEVVLNEKANAFFRKYKDYQERFYPMLDLRTSRNANGYWAQYATALDNTYLHHKIEEGRIDLTFNKAASKTNELQQVAEWLRTHSFRSVRAAVISKSGALEITVPKLDMKQPFDSVDKDDIKTCFDAISELVKFADIAALANKIGEK